MKCKACGQELPPKKRRRTCARCDKPIRRHDRWQCDGSTLRHIDCKNPTLGSEHTSAPGGMFEQG